jgi:RNA polymerase sigma-70 factor (ECF subfamily)
MIDLERFTAGDESHFAELVRSHGGLVLAVTGSFAHDADHAEDLFQEVWRQVYGKRGSYTGRGSFRAWLHRLATNVCRSEYRAQRTRGQALEQLLRDAHGGTRVWRPPDPLAHTEQSELEQRLHRALAQLSEREHEALLLRVIEGRTPAEVAGIMGVEKATVRSLIRHAVKRLRTILESSDDEDELSRTRSTR